MWRRLLTYVSLMSLVVLMYVSNVFSVLYALAILKSVPPQHANSDSSNAKCSCEVKYFRFCILCVQMRFSWLFWAAQSAVALGAMGRRWGGRVAGWRGGGVAGWLGGRDWGGARVGGWGGAGMRAVGRQGDRIGVVRGGVGRCRNGWGGCGSRGIRRWGT